jgi:hypothetical protein
MVLLPIEAFAKTVDHRSELFNGRRHVLDVRIIAVFEHKKTPPKGGNDQRRRARYTVINWLVHIPPQRLCLPWMIAQIRPRRQSARYRGRKKPSLQWQGRRLS